MRYSVTMRHSLAAIETHRRPSRLIALRIAPIAIATLYLLFAASACVEPPEEATAVFSATMANDQQFTNSLGAVATFSTAGVIDLSGPFFKSLGSNGRSCSSCHQLDEGLSITPSSIQSRFAATHGTD